MASKRIPGSIKKVLTVSLSLLGARSGAKLDLVQSQPAQPASPSPPVHVKADLDEENALKKELDNLKIAIREKEKQRAASNQVCCSPFHSVSLALMLFTGQQELGTHPFDIT